MDARDMVEAFSRLSTPLVADACVRLHLPARAAPAGIRPLIQGSRIAGSALPVKHFGSVDIFLEAMEVAKTGEVLVIDNNGRGYEGCVGDLIALEAKACGLAGIVIWGCHRDTAELNEIGLPVFSYGQCPVGPTRADAREPHAVGSARFGSLEILSEDFVLADDDGVLFVPEQHVEEVLSTAESIWETERRQAAEIAGGKSLRDQFRFKEYLAKKSVDPSYTFRKHLRAVGGALEE